MIPSFVDNPELASVSVMLPAFGIQFKNFISYHLSENYLTPVSSFSFELSGDELSTQEKAALIPGVGVQISINDCQQMCGFLDVPRIRSGRKSGTVWSFECREWNSPILDAHADPQMQFSATQTLQQMLDTAFDKFAAFGGGDISVITDASANRNVITGSMRGTKTNKNGTVVKSALAHAVKPYQHEGMWAFLSRVVQRFGLWMRPTADGQSIIVSQPDFTQDPSYGLVHSVSNGGQNNVEQADFMVSRLNQPSAILASGFGGGGVFANSTLRAAIFNPVLNAASQSLLDTINSYPGIYIMPGPDLGPAPTTLSDGYEDPIARPLYLYDSESHNLAELQSFLRRELSLRMRESLHANYTIEGHRLGGQPVAVDTVIQVDDEKSNNFSGPLWVLERTFSKRAGEGTMSTMGLIRLGTLSFA
jgi:prophage tail gpP-like protein